MRISVLIAVAVALPMIAMGQDVKPDAQEPLPPPAYKLLRFDEDYSRLSNPANRTDWVDPIKYIPLRSDNPSWYMSFGGEVRERFEGNYNRSFGLHGLPSDSYWLQRITLLADVHLGERVRFFAEGISGIIEGESVRPPAPVQKDPIDLLFAFVDVVPYLTDDERLTLRVGRFGMYFGSGRLVFPRWGPNIPQRFQGVELLYSRPGWDVTGFVTRPVRDVGELSSADHSTAFWGLYATHYFNAPRTVGLDLYYFGIHREHGSYASGSGDEHRHTLGAREFGVWNHWDWDAEQILQLGSFGDDSILAWAVPINAGYSWDTVLRPRLGLKAGISSGDDNSHDGRLETFDALFFASGYFNDAAVIRPQNIIHVHPYVTVRPTRTVSVDGGARVLWRYSRNDAVYGVPGSVTFPALNAASRYVGTAFDVNLTWHVNRHTVFQASYVHFLTASYVHQSGGSDMDYVSTTISFLF